MTVQKQATGGKEGGKPRNRLFFFKFIYFERERERAERVEQREGRERIPIRLHAGSTLSVQSDGGLISQTMRS